MLTTPLRFRFPVWAAATLCLAALLLSAACSSGEGDEAPSPLNQIPTDTWVVRVDGHEISGAWLRNWAVTQMLQIERSQMIQSVDECQLILEGRELLTKLVVVALEAERRGLVVSDEEVQQRLSEEMSRFPSTEAWLEGLSESGMSREDRKEQIRLETLFFRYEQEIVGPEVRTTDASDDNVRKYYDTYREELFQRPHRVHLRHLMRAAPREASAEERERERERVVQARSRVEAGEEFAEVCKDVSTDATALKGGDVGWIDENTPVLDEFKQELLSLEPGQMSAVLEGPHGYHLFLAEEVKRAGIEPFADVNDEIRERLFQAGLKRAMARHAGELREQLVAAEKIEFRNLMPYTGCQLTPKEATQLEELKDAPQD